MEKFPDIFNRKTLNEIIEQNQRELIKQVRKELYDKIMNHVNDCEKNVKYEFPEKLWASHRVTIANEIWDRFGEIKISMNHQTYVSTRLTSNKAEIPKDIKGLNIDFY